MYELLGIDIKTLDDGGFQFSQTIFILKYFEATGMDHCNGFPTPTGVEEPIGEYDNGPESKIYQTNSYYSVIEMIISGIKHNNIHLL